MKKSFLFIVCCLMCIGMQAQKSLPGLTFSKEPAVLEGQMKSATERGVSKVYLTYMKNLDTEESTTDSTELASDGKFSFNVSVYYTKMATLAFAGSGSANVLLTPGETAKVTFDPSKLEKKSAWTFKGPNSDFNRDNANYEDEYSEATLFKEINGAGLSKFNGMGVPEYKKYILDTYNNAVSTLESNKNLGSAFKEYIQNSYQVRTMAMMGSYPIILAYANKKQQSDYTAPEDYWDDVKSWKVFSNNPILYTHYIGDLEGYSESLVQLGGMSKPAFPESYNTLAKAKKYLSAIENLQPLTPEEMESLHKDCPVFETEILDKNAALKAMLEENEKNPKYIIKSIAEDLAGEDVFKALIAPYKGKPLLVDFWATWCGPCKAAMKTILPVKEELWGKVNFIYITGPTSPKATWKKMLPTIHGDHYYVTDAQWRTLLSQFESEGIPTYVVVDKDGNIVNKHIGYPGNDVIKGELMK